MSITVILISYQVQFFLEQCLASVRAAVAVSPVPVEIIVVDNAPGDGSVDYLKLLFPEVRFLSPGENLGFGKANNLAWSTTKSEHILFLNPDTLIPEHFFPASLAFLDKTPQAGALGYRMIDGGGRFLPESKRGFPTLWASFCKMSGIGAIFPKNRFFSGYYQGFLPENRPNPVPVLSGAALWVRRELLKKTGGFDPAYFLYAEDIDLSHQLGLTGFQNWYFPEITLLHFKGESSRKSPEHYRNFYSAMAVFVKKYRKSHFQGILAPFLLLLIRLQGHFAGIFGKTAQNPVIFDEKWPRIGQKQAISATTGCCLEPGDGLTYQETIALIEKYGQHCFCFVHGTGTNSVVGSPDPARPGYAAAIPANK